MSLIDTLVTRTQRLLVEHVTLQPNFRVENCAGHQRIAAQRALVDQYFQFHPFQINVYPVEFASGQWVS